MKTETFIHNLILTVGLILGIVGIKQTIVSPDWQHSIIGLSVFIAGFLLVGLYLLTRDNTPKVIKRLRERRNEIFNNFR